MRIILPKDKNWSSHNHSYFSDFDSAEVYTSFVFETAAPLQIMLRNQAPERRKKILKAVAEAVGTYVDKHTGKVRLNNEVICIAGKK